MLRKAIRIGPAGLFSKTPITNSMSKAGAVETVDIGRRWREKVFLKNNDTNKTFLCGDSRNKIVGTSTKIRR